MVNVYNWYDYIQPHILDDFRARSGIRVNYNVFDSNDTMAATLLVGHSGYDVVFPSGAYLENLIAAGAVQELDLTRLPNAANLDGDMLKALAVHDPGNRHAVPYTWGITGFAFDASKVQARLAQHVPLDSWSLLFDPQIAGKLADCGIGLYESPGIIVPSVLAWLGEPPNGESDRALERAAAALMAVRPAIRKISKGSLVDDLAAGELCVIVASNGDALQAAERARIAGRPDNVRFSIPKEGAVLWFDVAAVPSDAPHRANALAFINYLMDPAVAAANSNFIQFPNANAASQSGLQPQLRNRAIFPTGELAGRRIPEVAHSQAYLRKRTRLWSDFRTGHRG